MKKITILVTKVFLTLYVKIDNLIFQVKIKIGEIQEITDKNSTGLAAKWLLPSLVLLIFSTMTLVIVDYVLQPSTIEYSVNKRYAQRMGMISLNDEETESTIDSTQIYAEIIIDSLNAQNLRELEMQTIIMIAETDIMRAETQALEDYVDAYMKANALIDSAKPLMYKRLPEQRTAPPPARSPAPVAVKTRPPVIGGNSTSKMNIGVTMPVAAIPSPPIIVTAPKVQAPAPEPVVVPTKSVEQQRKENEVVIVTTSLTSVSNFPNNYFYYGRNNLTGRPKEELTEMFLRVYKSAEGYSTQDLRLGLMYWYYQDFINLVATKTKLPAAVIAAMFRIEGFRANFSETDLLALNNNPGGIKHRAGMEGRIVHFKDDCYNTDGEIILCQFAGYDTPEDGAENWAKIINADRYDDARAAARRGEPYAVVFRHFKNGGYWTAPGNAPINARAKYASLYDEFFKLRK